MNLRDLDLNLLTVFNQLMIDQSVSQAATQLGLTQPAVSNALRRLRSALDDDLFVRGAHGVTPTPYAMQLAEPLAQALNTVQAALAQREHFEPLHSTRSFHLALTDVGEIYFMPPLMRALAQRAPQVHIACSRTHDGHLAQDMTHGRVDLAVGTLTDIPVGFFQQRLFRPPYVCLYRRGHPLMGNSLSLEQFYALEHIAVTSTQTGHAAVDQWLSRDGRQRRVRVTVPHFVAVAPIVQQTDLVATVPQRYAERVQDAYGLCSCAHPAELPDIAINLYWHARMQRDPANLWLRQLLVELFQDDAPSPPP